MKLKRYYIDSPLKESSVIFLEGEEFHHLKNVMRSRVGDTIALFNGGTITAEGEILKLDKNQATIKVLKTEENLSEPKINFTLFQAVGKFIYWRSKSCHGDLKKNPHSYIHSKKCSLFGRGLVSVMYIQLLQAANCSCGCEAV